MVIHQVPGEVAPGEFREELFGARHAIVQRRPPGSPDHARRNLAPGEVFGKAGGRGAGRDVPAFGIVGQALVDEPVEPLPRGRLAHRGVTRDDRGTPAHRGAHPPILQRLRGGPAVRRGQPVRRGQNVSGIARPDRPPVRREHAVGPALPGLDRPRLEKNRAGEASRLDPGLPERLLPRPVAGDARGVVDPLPEDRPRPGFRDQRLQDRQRRAPAQDQRRSGVFQRAGEHRETFAQPPPRRRAKRLDRLVMDEDRDHRPAALRRTSQRRVIRKPQVAAEPDEDGR